MSTALTMDDERFLEERERRIKSLARTTAQSIVEIGGLLIEAKKRVEHGEFLKWIEKAFQWSEQTARNFMNVARMPKSTTVVDLPIDLKALYFIAAPNIPEPVRTEVIRRAEAGEPVTHEQVKLLRRKYEETGELPKSITTLVAMAVDAKKEIAANPLPTPAEARRIAIETGAHTLSSRGVYEPPMTVTDQKVWDSEFQHVLGLKDFIKWAETAGNQADFVAMLHRRHWAKWFTVSNLTAAADWITGLKEVLCANEKTKAS